ncbi:hypothetical protein AB0878_10915 [Amycolatopsis sp. NPDC047767]|uniref:hypothetical protein n=1 Tax=Amycolatopsis sp. NPDC047767 TaxID=3156765 RepID=UPI003454CE2B
MSNVARRAVALVAFAAAAVTVQAVAADLATAAPQTAAQHFVSASSDNPKDGGSGSDAGGIEW